MLVLAAGTTDAAVLCERKVLLVSESPNILHACAEALVQLLFPFEYTLVYIPILPRSVPEALTHRRHTMLCVLQHTTETERQRDREGDRETHTHTTHGFARWCSGLLEFCAAPTPYLIGVDRKSFQLLPQLDDVIIVGAAAKRVVAGRAGGLRLKPP